MPVSSGANPAARCAPAATATAAQPGERCVSTTNRNFENRQGAERAHASRQPGDRGGDAPSPAVSPTCGNCWRGSRDAAVQPPYRRSPRRCCRTTSIPTRSRRSCTRAVSRKTIEAMLFHRARRREDGSENPDFVLNQPQFRDAGILVTGHNFGAGSSRESAVWACSRTISVSSWRRASPISIARTACRTACCRSCSAPRMPMLSLPASLPSMAPRRSRSIS